MTDTHEVLFKLLKAHSDFNRLTSERTRIEAQLNTAGVKVQTIHDEAVLLMTNTTPFVLQDPDDGTKCVIIRRVDDKLVTTYTHFYKQKD